MSGADLTNEGLFFLLCLLTVLLVMFIVQVIRTPLEVARPAEQPVLNLPEPPPPVPAGPAPPRALPVRRPQVPAFPAAEPAMNGQSGNGAYSARHASPYAPVSRPEVTGGPPWGPAPRPSDLDGAESLSAGHPARLPSGRSAGPAQWHALARAAAGPAAVM
jgi:hypothetical protein